ncbi:MAG: restriction endonuclease subunit S [Dehalococcoidia bacterium]
MKYPAYRTYKPSGVEWLGGVPEHWDVKRLKSAATYTVSNVDKVAADDELPARLCNYTDVYYNDFIHPDLELMETTATLGEIRRFGLRVDDVVITKDSESWDDIGIPALVVGTSPDLVCGYHLAIVRPDQTRLLGRFLFRCLQSDAINQQFQTAATGVTRYGLPKGAIGEASVLFPPLSEQHAIADFLDAQTAKLDTLIAKKRELIEKLKEQRTALISQTVTRGLPPDAALVAGLDAHPTLKPSGVEWLGDVPEHWEVAQVKRKWTVLDCKHRTVPFVDDGVPVVGIGEVQGYEVVLTDAKRTTEEEYLQMIEGGRRPIPGDIIYSRNATVGQAALVTTSDRFCMGQDVCLLRSLHAQSPRYGLYLFRSKVMTEQAESLMIGSTFRRINVGQIMEFWTCLPPLHEQNVIADYLDSEAAKIDRMAEKVESAIERLQEYRTALITAAVTGKIDVREAMVATDATRVPVGTTGRMKG